MVERLGGTSSLTTRREPVPRQQSQGNLLLGGPVRRPGKNTPERRLMLKKGKMGGADSNKRESQRRTKGARVRGGGNPGDTLVWVGRKRVKKWGCSHKDEGKS